MPLRILKRTSRQYNVVSKSTFVISVTLLDNGVMECTLDADSIGNDCLHNISQRLGLHQPEFFGLRYISRGVPPRQRWIELQEPLKKQLDRYAEDSHLSLGVMHYVGDVNLLRDEMTRYHYFLQLKSDVIEGKLNFTIDQAISLAAYSLQAEFGDYDPERHTIEYLRDFAILPKDLISEDRFSTEINVDALFEAVARQYGSLLGFPPPLAEIYYIMVAQQLEGYGQECYPAKDECGNDILICVSLSGFLIRRRDWTHIAAFRWSDIKSLTGQKKILVLLSVQSHRISQFHFSDGEIVKYIRKFCTLQINFQKDTLKSDQGENQRQTSSVSNASHHVESIECPSVSTSTGNLRVTPDLIATQNRSQNMLNNNFMNQSPSNNSGLKCGINVHAVPGSSLPVISTSRQFVSTSPYFRQSLDGHTPTLTSTTNLRAPQYDRANTPVLCAPGVGYMINSPDLASSGLRSVNQVRVADAELLSLLPSYRPAPDYDTAMQLIYGRKQQQFLSNSDLSAESHINIVPSVRLFQTQNQEEVEPIYENEIVSKIHSTEIYSREKQPDYNGDIRTGAQRCSLHENASNYLYKPPPPYPYLQTTYNSNNIEHSHRLSQEINKSSTRPSPVVTNKSHILSTHNEPSTSAISLPFTDSHWLRELGSNEYECQLRLNSEEQNNVPRIVPSSSAIDVIDKSFPVNSTPPCIQNEETNLKMGNYARKEPVVTTSVGYRKSEQILRGPPNDPDVMNEFQRIPKAKVNPNFSTAMKRDNFKRNRFPNILPYEDNLIRLTSSRQNPDGYINASPISVKTGDRIWKYIVGQIPLPGSGSSTLWQMIWETGTKIIVSLERDSSSLFYPSEISPSGLFGDYQITECQSAVSPKASIARELVLTFLVKKKQRRVWILPYEEEWKDDIPIDTEHFLCFLEEVNSVQRKVNEGASPLTVLCGTGAGRSGVFVLSDILLHSADSGHKIRCDNLLGELRMERMLLVTYPHQYAFVLDTLGKYLAQSRLI